MVEKLAAQPRVAGLWPLPSVAKSLENSKLVILVIQCSGVSDLSGDI